MTRTLKYQIIKDWLVQQAADPVSRKAVPLIRQIRKHFGASLEPVTRPLQKLENEGLIECRQEACNVLTNRKINKAADNRRKTGSIVGS